MLPAQLFTDTCYDSIFVPAILANTSRLCQFNATANLVSSVVDEQLQAPNGSRRKGEGEGMGGLQKLAVADGEVNAFGGRLNRSCATFRLVLDSVAAILDAPQTIEGHVTRGRGALD